MPGDDLVVNSLDATELTKGGNTVLTTVDPPSAHQASHVTGADQIPTFGAAARGLVPASGGGTTNFLRADGSFAAPPGGGSPPTGTGFRHVTGGVEDGASKLVDLTAATDTAPNQGTTTTVLHGNAAGQASFGPVATGDISNDAVDNTKAANMAANTVKANPTAGSADPQDVAVGANTVLGRVAGNIVAAQLATAQVADDAITYAKQQNVSAASRLLGRGSAAGAGDPEEIALGTNLSMSGTTLNATIGSDPAQVADPAAIIDWFDDFDHGGRGQGDLGKNWLINATTAMVTSSFLEAPAKDVEHPGVVLIAASPDTAGTVGSIQSSEQAGDVPRFWSKFVFWNAWAIPRKLAGAAAKGDADWAIGCRQNNWSNAIKGSTDDAYFECNAGETNWFSVTSNAPTGGETRKDTGVAWSSGAWIFFEIKRVGNDYQFYINGVLKTTHVSGVDQVPRDIPGAGADNKARYTLGAQVRNQVSSQLPFWVVDWMQSRSSTTRTSGGGVPVTGTVASLPAHASTHKAGGADPISFIETKGGPIVNASGIASPINIIVWRAPYACTVTNVRGYRVGGTGATINARKNGSLNHLASALSLTSADTWLDGGAVQNTAYAAGDKMEIMLVTVTGSPTQVAIQVDVTRQL